MFSFHYPNLSSCHTSRGSLQDKRAQIVGGLADTVLPAMYKRADPLKINGDRHHPWGPQNSIDQIGIISEPNPLSSMKIMRLT